MSKLNKPDDEVDRAKVNVSTSPQSPSSPSKVNPIVPMSEWIIYDTPTTDEQKRPVAIPSSSQAGVKTKTKESPSDKELAMYQTMEWEHPMKLNLQFRNYVNQFNRTQAVKWIVKLCYILKVSTSIVHLTVGYFDQLIRSCHIPKVIYTDIAIVALYIAMKIEKVDRPPLKNIVMATQSPNKLNHLTKKYIDHIESEMFNTLDDQVCLKPACYFIDMYCKRADDMAPRAIFLALYIAELTLIEGDEYLYYSKSMIAAGAIVLARHTLGIRPWSVELEKCSHFCLAELEFIVTTMSITFTVSRDMLFEAVFMKYKDDKFKGVSKMPPAHLIDDNYFDVLVKYYEMLRIRDRRRFS